MGFARGTLLFTVVLVAPGRYGYVNTAKLSATLAAKQMHLEAVRYGGGEPTVVDQSTAIGSAAGSLVGYLLVVSGWAYFRDPFARRRWRGRLRRRFAPGQDGTAAAPAPETEPALDVTTDARRLRRSALVLLGISLLGFSVALNGFLPHAIKTRMVLWARGLAISLAAVWYRSQRGGRSGALWMVTGRRPVPATALFVVAIVAGLLACAFLMEGTIASGGAPDSQGYLVASGCFLAVAGIAHRRAHRLSALSARASLERDERPLVLYLRSFGDDSLRLRSATLGRTSLIERFSPNRFDSFEEIIARHLSAIGPVVAINRPGTELAPLGAARETIGQDEWQSVVDDWMDRAALVVIGAPPGKPSPGLMWELGHVSDRNRWAKTLLIVPPLLPDELRSRWQSFATEAPHWPTADEVGSDPSHVLALTRRGETWTAITAERRTEWTYAAALRTASRLPRNAAGGSAEPVPADPVPALA